MDQDNNVRCEEINSEEIKEMFNCYRDNYKMTMCRYGTIGCVLPANSSKDLRDIRNMKVYDNDVFVNTFLKSGTTLIQEMVWLVANDLDFETAASIKQTLRYPFLESPLFLSPDYFTKNSNDDDMQKMFKILHPYNLEDMQMMPTPRYIKTHLPMSLLPAKTLETCKVVYLARDPRDVVVSYYFHCRLMKMSNEDTTLKSIWKLFIKDLLPYSPYFPHLKEAWEQRNHPNMFFLFYEELIKDLPGAVTSVANFLGKHMNEEQILTLCDHLNIDNFKKNASVNLEDIKKYGHWDEKESFIRKGKVGDWKNYFDEDMEREAERWIADNLRGSDFKFSHIVQ